MESSMKAVVAVLELAASKRPLLLDFLLEAILNSPTRFAAQELASDLGVPLEKVGFTIYRRRSGSSSNAYRWLSPRW